MKRRRIKSNFSKSVVLAVSIIVSATFVLAQAEVQAQSASQSEQTRVGAASAEHGGIPTTHQGRIERAMINYIVEVVKRNGNRMFPLYNPEQRTVVQLRFTRFHDMVENIGGQTTYSVGRADFVDENGRAYEVDFVVSPRYGVVATGLPPMGGLVGEVESGPPDDMTSEIPTRENMVMEAEAEYVDDIYVPESVGGMEVELVNVLSQADVFDAEIDQIFDAVRAGIEVQGDAGEESNEYADRMSFLIRALKQSEMSSSEQIRAMANQFFPQGQAGGSSSSAAPR